MYGDLRDGPGMAARWVLAGPLLVLAIAGVPVALVAEQTWAWRFGRSTLGLGHHDDTFGEDFALRLSELLWGSWVVGLVVIVLVIYRRNPPVWPKIVVWPALVVGIGSLVAAPGGPDGLGGFTQLLAETPVWPLVVGGALAFGLAWLAQRVLTRPLSLDVLRSGLVIPIGLRGSGKAGELTVRHDQLLLDGVTLEHAKRGTIGIPWQDFRSVQPGELVHPSTLELPGGGTVDLERGPAVRVFSTQQDWVLPVDDAAAVAAAVAARSARGTRYASPMQASGGYGTLLFALFMVALTVTSVSMIFSEDDWSYLIGVPFFGLPAAALVASAVGGARKWRAEHPAGPPAFESPPPSTVPGWQPHPVTDSHGSSRPE